MKNTATFDRREGRKANLQSIKDASWQQVVKLLQQLDGNTFTEVLLQKGEATLSVAGGAEHYYVTHFTEDERSFVLSNVDQSNTDNVARLTVGGQPVELPMSRLVKLSDAIGYVRTFLENLEFDLDEQWVEE